MTEPDLSIGTPVERPDFDCGRLHQRLSQIYPYGWASTPEAGGPLFSVAGLGNFQIHFRGFFPRGTSGYVGAWEAWPAPTLLTVAERRKIYRAQ